jgi:hypothetical protein
MKDTIDKVVELNSPNESKIQESGNNIEKLLAEFLEDQTYFYYKNSDKFIDHFMDALAFIAKNQKEILNYIKLYK